ncbi:MAG: ABC transporter substrate-binding protein [Desulfobulbaceae bacterium]|nr:ABC transporter substrate-binding protein [Desulfobulbaceae bacterium]
MRRSLCSVLMFFFCLAGAANAATITDAAGRVIEVEKPFTRIISLYAAHTENLFSLGLDAEIIGVSKSEDYPAQALTKEVFDYRGDAEKFLAARPDLVLIRPMIERSKPGLVAKLIEAGIAVVSLQPVDIEETYSYWRDLGLLTGRAQAAENMVRDFKHDLASVQTKVEKIPVSSRKRVYFEAIHRKMKTFAPTSMAIFALTSAGGINAAPDAKRVRTSNIAAYGKERILARSEEIDVFLAQKGAMNRIDLATIVNEPGFAAIKAVREGQVFLINERLVCRPTLRLLDGIRQIGGILYPETFASVR